jgi:hypothetical protein
MVAKTSDDVQNSQTWSQTALQYENINKSVAFQDHDFKFFVAGELEIISLRRIKIDDFLLTILVWLWCIRRIRIWIWIHWFCWFGNELFFRRLITLTEKGILFNFFSFSNHVSVHDHVTNKKNQNYGFKFKFGFF